MKGYPVCLNIANRTCVVVGGGEVAERKVRSLLAACGRVVLVSPEAKPGLRALVEAGRITHVARPYREGDLADAFLAFAATDDRATNQAVAAEASGRGVLVNVADDREGGDFTLPAVLRQGDLVVAVATGGRSPAVARLVRDELAQVVTADYAALLEAAAEARAALAAQGLSVPGEVWQRALGDALTTLVREGALDRARAVLAERLAERRETCREQTDRRAT